MHFTNAILPLLRVSLDIEKHTKRVLKCAKKIINIDIPCTHARSPQREYNTCASIEK